MGVQAPSIATIPRRHTRAVSLVRRLLAGLVVGDRRLERALLEAAEHAERVETGELLLRLVELAELQIGLADILVRTEVLGIEAESRVVVLQCPVGIARLACGVAHQI